MSISDITYTNGIADFRDIKDLMPILVVKKLLIDKSIKTLEFMINSDEATKNDFIRFAHCLSLKFSYRDMNDHYKITLTR